MLTPELLGRSLSDAACYTVLGGWRDGRLQPVVNRALMLRYLQLLRALGVPAEQLRRWLWWFNNPDRCRIVDTDSRTDGAAVELCLHLQRTGPAITIICSDAYFGALPGRFRKIPKAAVIPASRLAKQLNGKSAGRG